MRPTRLTSGSCSRNSDPLSFSLSLANTGSDSTGNNRLSLAGFACQCGRAGPPGLAGLHHIAGAHQGGDATGFELPHSAAAWAACWV